LNFLNIDGAFVPYSVVPLTGDGACLLRFVWPWKLCWCN